LGEDPFTVYDPIILGDKTTQVQRGTRLRVATLKVGHVLMCNKFLAEQA